jgi:hypothetical protein
MIDNLKTDRPGHVWPGPALFLLEMSFLRAFSWTLLVFTILAICGNGMVSAGTTAEGVAWLRRHYYFVRFDLAPAVFLRFCFIYFVLDRPSIQSYP